MDPNLVIDDDYISTAGTYSFQRGKSLNEMYGRFVGILQEIRAEAITSGEIADALDSYIELSQQLIGQANEISSDVETRCGSFLTAINDADSYLF